MKRFELVIVLIFVLVFVALTTSIAEAGIDDGLVASYTFDGNANDSGSHHNGSVHGAQLTEDRFGHQQSAYNMAASAYIEIPAADDLNLKEQMERTISIWVKPSDTRGNDHGDCGLGMETIFASTNGEEGSCFTSPMGGAGTPEGYATVGYWFGFREGKLQFYLRNNESDFTNWVSVEDIAAPAVGQWSHIVIVISTVYDASSHVAGENFGRVWVYVNGVKQVIPGRDLSDVLGEPTEIIPFPTDYSHNQSLYVGGRYYDRSSCYRPCVLDFTNRQEGVGEFFAGAVDDLKIYNRILSGAEVQQLKNQGSQINPDPNPNPEPQADGNYNYYLPYFKSGGGSWSGFGVANSSVDETSYYSVYVYDQAGNLAKTIYPDPLPANGQASMAVGTETETTGWMLINSQRPLTGLSFFAHGLMADVPFVDTLSKKLVIPHIAQNSEWDTYVMLCNPADDYAEVSLICYDTQGQQAAFVGFTLPPRASEVYPLANFEKNLTGKVKISISRGSGVAGFALYTNEKVGGDYFAGINAVAVDGFSTPF